MVATIFLIYKELVFLQEERKIHIYINKGDFIFVFHFQIKKLNSYLREYRLHALDFTCIWDMFILLTALCFFDSLAYYRKNNN